jgi:hypothetical protein
MLRNIPTINDIQYDLIYYPTRSRQWGRWTDTQACSYSFFYAVLYCKFVCEHGLLGSLLMGLYGIAQRSMIHVLI